jgi:hypothetical protein
LPDGSQSPSSTTGRLILHKVDIRQSHNCRVWRGWAGVAENARNALPVGHKDCAAQARATPAVISPGTTSRHAILNGQIVNLHSASHDEKRAVRTFHIDRSPVAVDCEIHRVDEILGTRGDRSEASGKIYRERLRRAVGLFNPKRKRAISRRSVVCHGVGGLRLRGPKRRQGQHHPNHPPFPSSPIQHVAQTATPLLHRHTGSFRYPSIGKSTPQSRKFKPCCL